MTLVSGPPNASVYLDAANNRWMLQWHPPGPNPNTAPDTQIDPEWFTSYNFVFKVEDNGAPGGGPRSRQFQLHGGNSAQITFGGYHEDSDEAEENHIVRAQRDKLVARNDQFGTPVGGPLSGTVNPQIGPGADHTANATEFKLVAGGPAHAASWSWNEQNGSFSFTPAAGFEGVVTFQYYLKSDQGWWEETLPPGGSIQIDYEPIESNIATVTIEVGKAVRSYLTIDGLSEEDEDQGNGKILLINADDDNKNAVEDREELRGPIRDEDDLTRVEIDYWLRDDVTQGDFIANFVLAAGLYNNVRLWTTAEKEEEIIPYLDGEPNFWGNDYRLSELPDEIFVEGIDHGIGFFGLKIAAEQTTLFSNGTGTQPGSGQAPFVDQDNINVAVINVDLDIDSDNEDGQGLPDGSSWEETLEVHEYGLGKLIMLDNENRPFTPVVLNIGPNLDPDDPNLRVRIEWDFSTEAGNVRLWTTHKWDANRSSNPVQNGGHQISEDGEYSLSDLNYDPVLGIIVMFAEGTAENLEIKTLAGVEANGKPDERIKATVIANGAELGFDEVKYIVANEDSFFYHLQTRQEVRNELASRGVYDRQTMPNFSLKRLELHELRDLGIPWEIAVILGSGIAQQFLEILTGFNAVLYQDFITGEDQFLLAFEGTNDDIFENEWSDWINNIEQGVGHAAPQYTMAMNIADVLSRVSALSNNNLMTTGHSLGGGLASAAAVVAGIPADTYNAAGLQVNTLYQRDVNGDLLIDGQGQYVEIYAGSVARYNNATSFIDAYYVDWELLHVIQYAGALLGVASEAIGNQIAMDGPYDFEVVGFISVFVSGLTNLQPWGVVLGAAGGATYSILLHFNECVLYGLLVEEHWSGIGFEWDVLGYDEYF